MGANTAFVSVFMTTIVPIAQTGAFCTGVGLSVFPKTSCMVLFPICGVDFKRASKNVVSDSVCREKFHAIHIHVFMNDEVHGTSPYNTRPITFLRKRYRETGYRRGFP